MGVALSPKWHFIYGHVSSPNCETCAVMGDDLHVLLHCKRFSAARDRCIARLNDLYFHIDLTYDLILGLPPPTPKSFVREKTFLLFIHDQCLEITGAFLLEINSIHHL